MKNYYNILEVSESASPEVIDKAYRVLVKKYHPDLQANNEAAERKIREINEAYNILSDSFLKEQYDKELQQELQSKNSNNFEESDYGRLYREQQKLKYQLAHEKYDKERISRQKKEIEDEVDDERYTALGGIISLLKGIFRFRPTAESIKSIKKIDIFALILTIIIVIAIGAILYALPFTHDWMYRNFIDTPLLRWMVK